jgi:hypothetical protein
MSEYAMIPSQWPFHEDPELERFVESLELKYKTDCIRAIRRAVSARDRDRTGETTEIGELAATYVNSLGWTRRTVRAACEDAATVLRRNLARRRIDPVRLDTGAWSVASGEWGYLVDKGTGLTRWIETAATILGGGGSPAGAPPDRARNRSLTLRLTRVKCKDETGSGIDEWGEDDISMGAVLIDTSGASSKIGEFKIGGFDDGETKKINRDLRTFKLDDDYTPAKAFTALITLAEKDEGGFSEFLRKLYDLVEKDIDDLLKEIGAAAGAAIGASAGGSAGTLAGPLGVVLGAAAGAIVGAIVGWLINAFKDDIFKPQSLLLALSSPHADFAGKLVSAEQPLRFKGHHGDYVAYFVWRLERA